MRRALPPLCVAGAALAALEVAFALARGRQLFLTLRECVEFALASLAALTLCMLLVGGLIGAALEPGARLGRLALSAVAAGLGGWALWLLSEGRRVRDLPARPWVVALSAVGVGLLFAALLHLCQRLHARRDELALRRWRWLWGGGAAALTSACLLLDGLVLPRGYPAFHRGLLIVALVVAALGALCFEIEVKAPRAQRLLMATTLLLPMLAPIALVHLAAQPNASYAAGETAPWTAKLLKPFLARSAAPPPSRSQAAATQPAPSKQGVDLRDRDVLLITVDALRADVVRALGGSGLTPQLDALAQQGLVFRRAYTPAPHTSYALASLLTAKFLKPVVELEAAPSDHPTLPDLLRRYSYRTAAFYPPAIFFVDGGRFRGLAERGFGFEYRKEMFASAEARVAQLQEYLAQAQPGHPLFVWVHLFEPHEPYEPPAEFRRDESARGRYDGEVAYSDRMIGQLVALFRERKPGATVIVSADHGEEFGDHGGSYHGSTLFDEQVRVPVIWSSPGAVTPGISDAPIELVDVGSTILSTAGVARNARMRGDDLGPVLAGDAQAGPRFAFASVEDRHMATDGRFKVICSAKEAHCQLFDLQRDPREQRNLAAQRADLVAQLRAELFAFLGSIAQREVAAVEGRVGFPEALVRARVFAPGAGPDLLPLLAEARPVVRAAAARSLGELAVAVALPELERLRRADTDREVRAEAAIAALSLAGDAAADDVVRLLAEPEPAVAEEGLSRRRRAALALARLRAPAAVVVLGELARDAGAHEADRLKAVEALGAIGGAEALPSLIEVLAEVRLREAAAQALGRAGGPAAAQALLARLTEERYEPARRAEVEALAALGDRRVLPLLVRFLGTETSVPGGVRLLAQLHGLDGPSARGALLGQAPLAGWRCGERGCAPEPGARLVLSGKPPLAADKLRVILWVGEAEPGAVLRVDGASFRLQGGEQQLSFTRPRWQAPPQLQLASEGALTLRGWVVVAETPEIPPPAPEPWDAGASDG